MLLLALTEVRLLAQHFGISSVIKKDPDVVLTVADAARAQVALAGAPGTLRVIDEKTVYLRMPATFMQSEALLMVLKNLMRQNLERERKGEVSATPGKAPEPKPQPVPKPVRRDRDPEDESIRPAVKMPAASPKPQKPAKQRQLSGDGQPTGPMVPALEKLVSLRDQGILTEEEFQAAKKRLLAAAH